MVTEKKWRDHAKLLRTSAMKRKTKNPASLSSDRDLNL